MNINGFLQFFLDSIENEKILIIYDEPDVDDDVITVYLEDLPYAAIDISTNLDYMDVYCTFPYDSMISHEAKEAFKNLFSRIDIIMNYDRRNYKSKK